MFTQNIRYSMENAHPVICLCVCLCLCNGEMQNLYNCMTILRCALNQTMNMIGIENVQHDGWLYVLYVALCAHCLSLVLMNCNGDSFSDFCAMSQLCMLIILAKRLWFKSMERSIVQCCVSSPPYARTQSLSLTQWLNCICCLRSDVFFVYQI